MRVYRLLSVELLMLFTYDQILASPVLTPRTRRALAPLRAHEEAHVRALAARLAALGGVPPSPPANVAAADSTSPAAGSRAASASCGASRMRCSCCSRPSGSWSAPTSSR